MSCFEGFYGMTIITEIFVALFSLLWLGVPHSGWETNPILKHPAARIFIAILVIVGIVAWHFYPTQTVSDEEVELIFWHSVEKTNLPEDYCAYLHKYPQGEFVELAQLKCTPTIHATDAITQAVDVVLPLQAADAAKALVSPPVISDAKTSVPDFIIPASTADKIKPPIENAKPEYELQNTENEPLWMNALQELFGVTDASGKIKTASDKLSSIWFEQSFQNGKDNNHVIFIKSQPIDNAGNIDDCHACGVLIGQVSYKQMNGAWKIISKQKDFTKIGSYGDAPNITQAKILQISSDKNIFLIHDSYMVMGEASEWEELFLFSKNSWHHIGGISAIIDNSASMECNDDNKKCINYEGKVSVIPSNKEYPDILVTKTGTDFNRDKDKAILAKNDVYVFNGKKYELKP